MHVTTELPFLVSIRFGHLGSLTISRVTCSVRFARVKPPFLHHLSSYGLSRSLSIIHTYTRLIRILALTDICDDRHRR
jgi:hypothetical protein